MFTGIIEEMGTLEGLSGGSDRQSIKINASLVLEGTKIGDSIAVNGVCLTVTDLTSTGFAADVMPETVRRTNLSELRPGSPVNLERAMAADGRFGGHIVSGHIDGTGKIRTLRPEGNAVWVEIAADRSLLRGIVEKGSIAIDGISLTVARVTAETFAVSVIPHTGKETTLLGKKVGDLVNLETDIVGKYVERMLSFGGVESVYAGGAGGSKMAAGKTGGTASGGLTEDFLREHGF